MTLTISVPWLLVLVALVLVVIPMIYGATRPRAGDYSFDMLPLVVAAACWPLAIVALVAAVLLKVYA